MESKSQCRHGMDFRVASNTSVCGSLFRGCRCQAKTVGLDRLIPSGVVKDLPANPISKVTC